MVIELEEGVVVFAAGARLHRWERLIWKYLMRAVVMMEGGAVE